MPNGNNNKIPPTSLVPTTDQMMGQLRLVIPAIGTIISAFGIVKPDAVNSTVGALMTAIGPIAYVVVAIWSFIANSRASIIAAAAKPVDKNTPPPQIILPKQESALAQTLPDNVTTSDVTKVVLK